MALLAEGWDFDAYRAGKTVFRFPRRAEVAERLVDEIRLLEYLRATAAFDAQIPLYRRFGAATERFPYPFAGYRLIGGAAADDADLSRRQLETLAGQIGEWLDTLHDTETSGARAAGMAVDTQDAQQRLERLRRQADVTRSALPDEVADQWEPYLSGEIDVPDAYSGRPVLLHNDLVAEHLIVEPETGELVGVIDFTDAALGDPAQDFVGLLVAFGESFVRRALDAYDRRIDVGFRKRLEFRADLLRLTQLVEAVRRGDDAEKYRERMLDVRRLL